MPVGYQWSCSMCTVSQVSETSSHRPVGWTYFRIDVQKRSAVDRAEYDLCPGCWGLIKAAIFKTETNTSSDAIEDHVAMQAGPHADLVRLAMLDPD